MKANTKTQTAKATKATESKVTPFYGDFLVHMSNSNPIGDLELLQRTQQFQKGLVSVLKTFVQTGVFTYRTLALELGFDSIKEMRDSINQEITLENCSSVKLVKYFSFQRTKDSDGIQNGGYVTINTSSPLVPACMRKHALKNLDRSWSQVNAAKVALWYTGEFTEEQILSNDLHHLDCNSINNELQNLSLMTRSEHMTLHNNMLTPETLRAIRVGELRASQIKDPNSARCTVKYVFPRSGEDLLTYCKRIKRQLKEDAFNSLPAAI